MTFDYSNLAGRGPRRFTRVAGVLLPGVARVQADVEPFAARWGELNRAALADDGPAADPLWVALGDSLTQGIGASDPWRGWVGRTRDELARRGRPYRVVNLGVSGATTADVIARQLPVLATLPADLVTVMIGSNDLMQPSRRRALVTHFATLLHRLPRGSVVTTLPNPTAVARRVNDELEAVARARGLVVAELRDGRTSSWRGRLAADHFHPNDLGYAAIAEVMTDVLTVTPVRPGRSVPEA